MSLLDAAGVVTGDIWCSGAFSFESPLKDLLDSGEYTLEQLLAEDELLQELRGVHPQLIEFFSTEAAVTGLVKYVTLPPNGTPPPAATSSFSIPLSSSMVSETLTVDEENDNEKDKPAAEAEAEPEVTEATVGGDDLDSGEKKQGQDYPTDTDHDEKDEKDKTFVRYPYMSCEVICCEIKGIIDLLVDGYVPLDMEIHVEDKEAPSTPDEPQKDSRRSILDLLFGMLFDAEAGEIDDYRAGYFDKILSVLFRKRPQSLADYINTGGGRGQEALMKAMFKHLYSHSIMQIVQRLLLPQPPLPPGAEEENEDKEGEGLYSDLMDGGDMDGFGSFRCTWPDSEKALTLLLDCLVEKSPFPEIEENEERQLSLYQNASEVLITVIQNSPLTSTRLHTLTTDPVMDRLIRAATLVPKNESFSPHDCRQTCTMNVIESLILQLGGYGSVATMMYPEDEEDAEDDEGPGESAVAETKSERASTGIAQPEMATSKTLIRHLPFMLSNLCHLLQHPHAENWTSPMQFSKDEPQNILGSSRLRIVRLLESLVLLGDPDVDSKLCESRCLEISLDLFWKFQWCSMLHQSVANLLVHIFEGANMRAELQSYFVVNCNLLGRLMNSFRHEIQNAVSSNMEAGGENDIDKAPSSIAGETGSSVCDEGAAVISVESESDPENDVEQEPAENDESVQTDGRQVEHTPPQSFRLGYMGHVIIICQALVHACSNEGMEPSVGEIMEESGMNGELGEHVARENEKGEMDVGENAEVMVRSESTTTDETQANPLILAQLVESHELKSQWEDFVQSTLASETAVQSTPLGGFPAADFGDIDPLHMHRPGLAEDDDYDDDDGAAPPLPPRGLLVGGDVIDMDDNDLDVAASMMAGLSIGRNDGNGRSDQDLLAGIPPQHEDGARPSYMFDDPLGDGRFGRFDGDDSSSDEESSELSRKSGDSGGAVVEGVSGSPDHSSEAPVMDLFAGNFEAFDSTEPAEDSSDGKNGGDWSDFANFDNAFEGPDGTAAVFEDPFEGGTEKPSNIDEIFGGPKDHAELLENAEDPASEDILGQPAEIDTRTEELVGSS